MDEKEISLICGCLYLFTGSETIAILLCHEHKEKFVPNLKDEIVKRLEEFPATVVEGKPFREYLEDLAEDIQADVIKAMVNSPNRAALEKAKFEGALDDAGILWRVEMDAAELEHEVDQLANDVLGASLNNAIFVYYTGRGERLYYSRRKRLVRAMLKTLLQEHRAAREAGIAQIREAMFGRL